MRNVARQNLSSCRQKPTENVAQFATRFRKLITAATVGLSDEAQQARLLDEFIDRLYPQELAFMVKAAEPVTFQEAFAKA